jgi:hypothetical protein
MATWVEDPGWQDRIHADLVDLMTRLGGEILSDAEAACPVSRDGSNGNEPGHLRNSLRRAQEDTTVRVGTDVDYGLYVEEGHRVAYRNAQGQKVFTGTVVPPQPFLRPALYRERGL